MLWGKGKGLGYVKRSFGRLGLTGLASLLNIIDYPAQDEIVRSVLYDGRFRRLSVLLDKQYKGLKKVKS